MPEDTGVQQRQLIAARQVVDALGLVTMMHGAVVERPEPVCSWPKLCGQQACRFPRYFRGGEPAGLVAYILLELGYPGDLLKALDTEYEIGEVLHPGVKIARSRNCSGSCRTGRSWASRGCASPGRRSGRSRGCRCWMPGDARGSTESG
jgi:hypothetical protein